MNRLLVALLAAFDALIAAAVGVGAALAPLTVLWVLGLGGTADWAALWPASVRLWQLGQLVPLQITLPPEYLTATGLPADAATFTLSLVPLAAAGATALFAARSGARAARSGAWVVGVASGGVVTLAVAWLLWSTSANQVVAVSTAAALLLPVAVFAVPALLGAIIGAWRHGDDGIIDALRIRLEHDPRNREVAEASARGLGVAVLGFVAAGALLLAVLTILRGGEMVALFESAHVDALGAVIVGLAQLAYLPTLVVWGGAFAAGPGFSIGAGTAVSPSGVELGVLPGIPVLGLVPTVASSWTLLLVLLIVAVGFVAGATARRRLLDGGGERDAVPGAFARAVALAVIVLGGAGATALLAVLASGSFGPGRLAQTGPSAGPVALAVGAELLVGAAIALFSPVRRGSPGDRAPAAAAAPASTAAAAPRSTPFPIADDAETAPLDPLDLDPLASFGDSDDHRPA